MERLAHHLHPRPCWTSERFDRRANQSESSRRGESQLEQSSWRTVWSRIMRTLGTGSRRRSCADGGELRQQRESWRQQGAGVSLRLL